MRRRRRKVGSSIKVSSFVVLPAFPINVFVPVIVFSAENPDTTFGFENDVCPLLLFAFLETEGIGDPLFRSSIGSCTSFSELHYIDILICTLLQFLLRVQEQGRRVLS